MGFDLRYGIREGFGRNEIEVGFSELGFGGIVLGLSPFIRKQSRE